MKGLFFYQLFVLIGVALLLTGCDKPDTVIITNKFPLEVGIMIDGANSSTEFTGKTYITNDDNFEIPDDIIARGDGIGSLVAFNYRRPPFMRSPISWRSGLDIVAVPFEDEISLDFTVWIVDVDMLNTVTNRCNETLDALAYAEQKFVDEKVGLLVGDVRVVDMTNDSDAQDLRDCDPCNDAYFQDLKDDIGFDDGRINIYLVRKANPTWGRYYGRVNDIGGEQIIMGMYTGAEDLLIHEIAHNLKLEHVDGNSNFDKKNVAISKGSSTKKRQYITEGQTFRMHFHEISAINDTYNARPGLYTTSDCDHSYSASTECPAVQKRIWSDGSNWPAN